MWVLGARVNTGSTTTHLSYGFTCAVSFVSRFVRAFTVPYGRRITQQFPLPWQGIIVSGRLYEGRCSTEVSRLDLASFRRVTRIMSCKGSTGSKRCVWV